MIANDHYFDESTDVFNRVRSFKWVRGVLRFRDYFFINEQDAINYANSAAVQHAKVFNTTGQMIYQVANSVGNVVAY
jgi:hypothetical protein